jgi:hypothetical protein
MPKGYGASGQNETRNRAAVARFLHVTEDYLSTLPGLHKKVRVAFDWTLDLLFPKDVCVVHDLPHRCDPDRMAPINNGVSLTDIKLLCPNKVPDLAVTMEER